MINYCTKCVLPDTKPDLTFNDDGVCSACEAHEARVLVDWKAREEQFKHIVTLQRAKNLKYDCIVPVSGGKDSTYQVVKCLEYGLRPLAVTATTCDLTELGRKNLDNIGRLGVDHIEVTINRQLRAAMNKYCLQTVGDISWPEHVAIFTIPVQQALNFNSDLIIYGENPQNEYGGPFEAQQASVLNSRWLSEFGGLNALRIRDVRAGLQSRGFIVHDRCFDLFSYPVEQDRVNQLFLGYYFPWDGYNNAMVAEQHGFKRSRCYVEGAGVNYENLDNYQTGIHDYFKFLKFGFGRATDLASTMVRNRRFTRQQAVEHVLTYDGMRPDFYLKKPLVEILAKIDMTVDEFYNCVHEFTNRSIFDDNHPYPTMKQEYRRRLYEQ